MAEDLRLQTVVKEHVLRVYDTNGKHVRRTAKVLGVGYTTVYRMLRKWGLKK